MQLKVDGMAAELEQAKQNAANSHAEMVKAKVEYDKFESSETSSDTAPAAAEFRPGTKAWQAAELLVRFVADTG
eukprot:10166019-Karenia_brevis.AAC.1